MPTEYGATMSLQDLKAAGWQPGGKITVDGATFTLPTFGSASGDNVMAANQTIQMNGASGQALVFLGFSTYGFVSSERAGDDYSSPAIPDDTKVSGTQCTLGNGHVRGLSRRWPLPAPSPTATAVIRTPTI